jgi:hypothetical protein
MKTALICIGVIAGMVVLAWLVSWLVGMVVDRADGAIDDTLGRDEHEDGLL